jgi:hypothetical protein
MKQKSTFGLALKPALIISAAVVAYSLVIWSIADNIDQQQNLGWFSYIILALGYFYYTKNYRVENKNDVLTYGEGFVFMLFITMIYSVIQSLYTYVFMTFIDPEIINQIMEKTEESLYNKDMPEEQIEQSLEVMSFMFKPWLISLMAVFGTMFWGTLLSLIMAIFTKKQAQPTFDNQ